MTMCIDRRLMKRNSAITLFNWILYPVSGDRVMFGIGSSPYTRYNCAYISLVILCGLLYIK